MLRGPAGYTGALELHELLGNAHDITVVANTHEFVFIPSLIWYPFDDPSFERRVRVCQLIVMAAVHGNRDGAAW